ncbi:pyridoxal phosphate-dependent aminotransferase [candidate division KSB1 bacterium]
MTFQVNRRQMLKTGAAAIAGLSLSCKKEALEKLAFIDFPTVSDVILLDQNENPYGISQKTQQAIIDAMKFANRYPESHQNELKELIVKRENVETENITIGAGATEIFRLSGILYGLNGGEIITADPTYFGFKSYLERIGGKLKMVKVDGEYKHNLDEMANQITDETKMVYVVNPNNPVGTIVNSDELRSFCKEVSKKVPVFVDEAYHEFVDDPGYSSMADLVNEDYDIIVARTFSKVYGLAGMRVGFGIANKKTAEKFNNIQTNFAPCSVTALRAGIAAYEDKGFINDCLQKNREVRIYLIDELKKLGYFHIPSHTNFVIFRTDKKAVEFRDEVLKHNVRIRPFEFHDEQWVRVSMGTMNEVQTLVSVLNKTA